MRFMLLVLMRFSYDISCFLPLQDFMFCCCILCSNTRIYLSPKLPPWNASKSIRIFENDLQDVACTHALVVRGFGRVFRLVARR
jgi:hypothetical protein